jgi:3-hydroxyisobutyrate dehydrogenase-like beta-hydroxyacid dehydrogenase
MSERLHVCLIGFGEVGETLAHDLTRREVGRLSAWDLKFSDRGSAPSRAAAAAQVHIGADVRDAVADAAVVISAVTAAQDLIAAEAAAPHLAAGAYFLDLNSVSPGVKQQTARVIERAGGLYVEAAIMSPIAPQGSGSPMLLGGPHASAFLPLARELGFTGAHVFSDQIGRASAAKMCRSIMIKGMEALLAESLLAARRHGVEGTVIDSLRNLFAAENWRALARYMISRSLMHGVRRAEEMREAAKTVTEAGVEPWMSSATAQRQEWAAQFRSAASEEELEALLDSLLAAQVEQGGSRC